MSSLFAPTQDDIVDANGQPVQSDAPDQGQRSGPERGGGDDNGTRGDDGDVVIDQPEPFRGFQLDTSDDFVG